MTTEATTITQLEDLLHASNLTVDYGAELLDANDVLVEDISADLKEAGYVARNNYGTVHGSCRLLLSRAATWETARARPYVTCSGAGYWKRWNLGLYLISNPQIRLGESPLSYDVTGKDKLRHLAAQIGDSYYVASGTGYLDAVRQVIVDSGLTGLTPLLDGTAEATTLSSNLVWLLDPSGPPSWLRVANDLLRFVGYRGLYIDRDGAPCSEPWQSPGLRTPSWLFDLTNSQRQMVREERELTNREDDRTNYFTFVQQGMTTEPTSGAGLYIVDNSGTGAEYPGTWWLNVESQTELEAEGDRMIEEMTQRKRIINFPCSPAPFLWHFDVVDYHDLPAGGYLKGQVMDWKFPLDRSDMQIQMEVIS